ncbi:MAG TPA: VOC family protein [Alphaproteobacteria bacterium]|nr:VOC family protein [Alphaproteobacteria bacterium]
MSIRELGYVVIGSPDLGKWRDYGTKVLGMAAVDGPDGVLYLKMDERDFRLAIQKSDRDQLFASGWAAADEASFHAIRARIEKSGTGVEAGSKPEAQMRKVQDFFSFRDPAGLRHEVSWGHVAAFTRFVSPLGTRFITRNLGLGHVVLPAPNIQPTVEFWSKVMGFGVGDLLHLTLAPNAPPISVYFMHCDNGRQHSLAFAELGDPTGCNHMMVEVDSMDEVGRALDRVEQNGVQLTLTLGRHVNDEMISFYMMTPGGFQMEYGTGGVVKDWTTHTVFETTRGSHWGHKFLMAPPAK